MSFADALLNAPKHKAILAERFRTKMCRTWVDTGCCPYEARCMFAHGDDQLRTKCMNMADGLTTDDAIKAFQRGQQPSPVASDAVSPVADDFATVLQLPQCALSAKKPAPLEPSHLERFVAALCTPSKQARANSPSEPAVTPRRSPMSTSSPDVSPKPRAMRFRHDPYAPVVFAVSECDSPSAAFWSPSIGYLPTSMPSPAVCELTRTESAAFSEVVTRSPAPVAATSYGAPGAVAPQPSANATPNRHSHNGSRRGNVGPKKEARTATPSRALTTYGMPSATTYCAAAPTPAAATESVVLLP